MTPKEAATFVIREFITNRIKTMLDYRTLPGNVIDIRKEIKERVKTLKNDNELFECIVDIALSFFLKEEDTDKPNSNITTNKVYIVYHPAKDNGIRVIDKIFMNERKAWKYVRNMNTDSAIDDPSSLKYRYEDYCVV